VEAIVTDAGRYMLGGPWRVEEELIRSVSLPLNLDQNRHHNFHAALSAMRRAAKMRARELPVM